MADAPPLKLWNNKKEQEKYENLAGTLCSLHRTVPPHVARLTPLRSAQTSTRL